MSINKSSRLAKIVTFQLTRIISCIALVIPVHRYLLEEIRELYFLNGY
jgi:hypothetical protein